MTRRALAQSIAGALLLSGCSQPSVKRATKSGSENRAPAASDDNGDELQLDYAILMDADGGAKRIDEKYHFRSGDRFRIQLRPAFEAHIYLLNRGPKQPEYTFLFPSPKISLENPLEKDKAVTLPDQDRWFSLDHQPGVENVVLIASPRPMVEFNTPEVAIPRDECEDRIALVERDYRPMSSRRFEDKDWTKLFAARGDKTAIVLRMPLDHR